MPPSTAATPEKQRDRRRAGSRWKRLRHQVKPLSPAALKKEVSTGGLQSVHRRHGTKSVVKATSSRLENQAAVDYTMGRASGSGCGGNTFRSNSNTGGSGKSKLIHMKEVQSGTPKANDGPRALTRVGFMPQPCAPESVSQLQACPCNCKYLHTATTCYISCSLSSACWVLRLVLSLTAFSCGPGGLTTNCIPAASATLMPCLPPPRNGHQTRRPRLGPQVIPQHSLLLFASFAFTGDDADDDVATRP